MSESSSIRLESVPGPNGEPLTLADLPPADTTRWVARRKAEVVAAVAGGLLSVDEACERYRISGEEFDGWRRTLGSAGLRGLRVTSTQKYRSRLRSEESDPTLDSTSVSLTTDAPSPPERRLSARAMSIFRVGKLIVADGEELCRIRNLSAGGMMIELSRQHAVGEPVTIELREDARVTGRIIWTNDLVAGVAFDVQQDIAALLTGRDPHPGHKARPPRIELPCRARLAIGAVHHNVFVRDISQGGLKIVLDDPECRGKTVLIVIEGLRPVRGVIRWVRGGHAGVSFDQPIPFEELAFWLGSRLASPEDREGRQDGTPARAASAA